MAGRKTTETQANYKDTLNLPQTDFLMKANLPQREPEMLARWDSAKLYEQIISARRDAPLFVLHDGPPFANGDVHIGHVLDKVLKDVVVKYKSMTGFRAPYVPGWDCHGLPIEFKVTQEMRKADELRLFADLVEKGVVYRGKKPIYWCATCRTALAEAEVEYHDHVSPSVYVKFPVNGWDREFAVIWTTTPWTLPANLAIAVKPDLMYVRAKVNSQAGTPVPLEMSSLADRAKNGAPTITQDVTGGRGSGIPAATGSEETWVLAEGLVEQVANPQGQLSTRHAQSLASRWYSAWLTVRRRQ